MPAPKLFLSTSDISMVTGFGLRESQYMMKMFTMKGKTVAIGRGGKIRAVDINILARYLSEQDGTDPKQRKKEIVEILRATQGGLSND